MPRLVQLSVLLLVAGEAVVLFAVGAASWPLILGWALAAAIIAFGARVIRVPLLRILLSALLMPVCVLLAFEGGMFFLPAAAALLAAAIHASRRSVHYGPTSLETHPT